MNYKPVGKFPNWLTFILNSNNKPAKVVGLNDSGGIGKGLEFTCFGVDKSGCFYAIFNRIDNAVWCHKDNLKISEIGTVFDQATTRGEEND